MPDPAILQYCYFRQIQDLKPLADDIAYCKRAQPAADATDQSFEFLFEAANRYLRMKREDSMQEQLSRGLNGASDKALPGIDPRGKGKTKNVKADKSRQRGGPPNPNGTNPGKQREGKRREGVCYAYHKGTCTKGKECAYAHVKEISSPNAAGKAAGGTSNSLQVLRTRNVQVRGFVQRSTRKPWQREEHREGQRQRQERSL